MKNNILLFPCIFWTNHSRTTNSNSFFGWTMVIQQSTQINIWGWAEKINCYYSLMDKDKGLINSDGVENGKPLLKLNRRRTLLIHLKSNRESITLKNIMVGGMVGFRAVQYGNADQRVSSSLLMAITN